MFGQFRVIQPFDCDAFSDLVPVGTVHQFKPVAQDVVAADKVAAHADGPACRGHINGKVFLNFVDDLEDIAAFAVHLVTECQDRQVAHAADLEQLLRLAFHAFRAVNHHHGRVNGGQRAVGIFGKVRVAGRIHKVKAEIRALVHEIEGHGRSRDRDAAILFHRHKVRAGATRLALGADLTGHLDRPAEQQEFLCQRGFPRIGVGNDRKGATPSDFGRQSGAV